MGNIKKTVTVENFIEKLFTEKIPEENLKMYFTTFYSRDNGTVHYSQLTGYIYRNYDKLNLDEQTSSGKCYWKLNLDSFDSIIASNVGSVDCGQKEKCNTESKNDDKQQLEKISTKIREHILLASIQYETFFKKLDDVNEQAKKIEEESMEISKKTREISKETDKLSDRLNSLTPEFITILGIFSALIFGMFGGFDAFKEIFANLSKVRISTTIMAGPLLILGLITLIFVLIQSICTISGKNLLACEHTNNSECKCSFYKKYPMYVTSVVLFTAIAAIAAAVHVGNKSGAIYSETNSMLFIVLTLIIVIFITIFWIFEQSSDK